MKKKTLMFYLLAVLGTVLDLFPIAFMLFTSLIGSIQQGTFLMDYLIPAEFAFLIYIGGFLLLVGVWNSLQDRKFVFYGVLGTVGFFGLIMLLSVVSGIDHTPDPTFGQYLAIWIPLFFFCLSSLFIGVIGIRYIFHHIPKKR